MKTISIQILFTLIAIEIVFRLFGYTPYSIQKYSLASEPSKYMLPDDSLGFRLNEGVFKVTINDSVKYTATHTAKGQRTTSFVNNTDKELDRIVLFGGSFPYGMGTDDSLSYPFLLQKAFPNEKIESQCVPGYGTVQSLTQIKKSDLTDLVILHYASFYDDRNALTPEYRVALHHGFMNSNQEARALYNQANYPFT